MTRWKSAQQGISLISLMVGLAISMIVLLATLVVYKSTVATSARTGQAAHTDGQRMAALLTVHNALQAAGYGIDAPAMGADIVVLGSAAWVASSQTLTGTVQSALPASGSAVVWGQKEGATYFCQGIFASATGGLYSLSPVACASASVWDSVVWTRTQLVDETDAAHKYSVALKLASGTAGCAAFGISGAGKMVVDIAAPNSTDAVSVSTSTVCLSNFPV